MIKRIEIDGTVLEISIPAEKKVHDEIMKFQGCLDLAFSLDKQALAAAIGGDGIPPDDIKASELKLASQRQKYLLGDILQGLLLNCDASIDGILLGKDFLDKTPTDKASVITTKLGAALMLIGDPRKNS